MFLTYADFVKHYKKFGRCPNDIHEKRRELTELEIQQKYIKYLGQKDRQYSKEYHVDEKYMELINHVNDRDKECRFYKLLTDKQKEDVRCNLFGFNTELEVAHIFGKGAFPYMKYMKENCILLYHLFHSRIDKYLHPISGKPIDKLERYNFFRKIIGDDLFDRLEKIAHKKD